MWVLWFILTVNGVTLHTPLTHFHSEEECHETGHLVLDGMRKAYPEDQTMHYTCSFIPLTTKGNL